MPIEELQKIIPILKNSGMEHAGVFGSVRGAKTSRAVM